MTNRSIRLQTLRERLEERTKHLPGKHAQQSHAGSKTTTAMLKK